MNKRVFISHHSKDDEHIGKMRQLLSDKDFHIRNSSIDSSRPNNAKNEEYIKKILRERINWAGVCVVLISDTTHNREWVNWEVKTAEKQGKRIVGVHCHSHNNCEIPEALKEYADAIVGWRSERIIGAINGEINNFEDANCNPLSPLFVSSSSQC
jgi:hypothetical protein